jgi:hypothetical protein
MNILTAISRAFVKRDPLVRPIDQAINEHKRLLRKWESKQQKEIVAALLQHVFPCSHVHANPYSKNERKANVS